MPLRLNTNFLESFISENDYNNISDEITRAHELLNSKQGAGSDFLGWLTLPEDYDKQEFALIKSSAEKSGGDFVGAAVNLGGGRFRENQDFDASNCESAGARRILAQYSRGYLYE